MVDDVAAWFDSLTGTTAEAVTAALDYLEQDGPQATRPIIGKINGSAKITNLKEIRPHGTDIRILFVFDPQQQAVLLVAGDKSKSKRRARKAPWNAWYPKAIKQAEEIYEEWSQGGFQ